jgi:2-succinyl-5-enolpyruvyl-6-hydroxy-3-cyclohexene-1-carboxylate synthase
VRVHVHHDERSGAFVALGLGLVTGRPAAVLTTSGTAAAELHPAVVEADLAGLPLLVCTADRPPELRDVGAPQAIDQVHLYGRAARWYGDPGVPEASGAGRWRAFAARALAATGGARPVTASLPIAVEISQDYRVPDDAIEAIAALLLDVTEGALDVVGADGRGRRGGADE